MLDDWHREMDFFSQHHAVHFRNSHHSAIIKEISIEWNDHSDELSIEIKPTKDKELGIYKDILKKHYPEQSPTSTHFNLNNKADLDTLIAFFEEINLNQKLIPQELITEITNIFIYANKLWCSERGMDIFKVLARFNNIDHIAVPKFHTIFALKSKWLSPSYEEKHNISKGVKQVAAYTFDFIYGDMKEEAENPKLKKENEKKREKQVAKLCASGANLNVLVQAKGQYRGENLLLLIAVKAHLIEPFRILLACGADPRLRWEDEYYESPLEYILCMQEEISEKQIANDMLNAINWVINKPQRTLDSSLHPETIYVYPLNNAIKSEFTYPNSQRLNAYFTSADISLPNDESQLEPLAQELYQFFKNTFSFRHNQPYRVFKNLFGKDKYVDVVFKDRKIIGFNFFKFHLPDNKYHFTWYCAYTAIRKEFQGHNLGKFLAHRFAFAVQKKYFEKIGGTFALALTYPSFRTTESFEPYPKNQAEITDEFMEEEVYPEFKDYIKSGEELHKDDGIGRYFNDDDIPPKPNLQSTNPNEILFYRHILNLTGDPDESKVVPIYFLTNEDNFKKFAESMKKVHIDLPKHVSELSKCLSIFFNKGSEKGKNTAPNKITHSKL